MDETSFFLSARTFSPIELYWEKLTIIAKVIDKKKKKCPPCSRVVKNKVLLNDVTGIARPGTFTAILGPSGHNKKYVFERLKLILIIKRKRKNDIAKFFVKSNDELKFKLFRNFANQWEFSR